MVMSMYYETLNSDCSLAALNTSISRFILDMKIDLEARRLLGQEFLTQHSFPKAGRVWQV